MKKQSSEGIIIDSNLGLLSSCFELKKKKKCCKKYKKGKICKKCPKNHAWCFNGSLIYFLLIFLVILLDSSLFTNHIILDFEVNKLSSVVIFAYIVVQYFIALGTTKKDIH